MMQLPLRRLASLVLLAGLGLSAAGAELVHYPRPESEFDERTSYPIALLKLSLQKSGRDYALAPSDAHMQQGRSLRFLEQGHYIDIVWTVTSAAREQAYMPIRIPIDRGLIGWRLLLIRADQLPSFATIRDRDDLARRLAGQGHDWPDTDVLVANQFKVATSASYEGLFKMLERGHIDYFPRSVTEVWPELAARPHLGLEVAPTLVLHYPQAMYYFVNRQNTALAAAVEKGLRASMADGSMQQLFEQFYGAAIARARLGERVRIDLPNPALPASARLNEAALWFEPSRKAAPAR